MKMVISNLFFGLALASITWGIVSMIAITNFVAEQGTKVNFFLYRIYVIKYVSQYKRVTEKENGKPGPWFYSFVVSMNLTWALAIIGFVLKSLQ
jgi:hypothetical protein